MEEIESTYILLLIQLRNESMKHERASIKAEKEGAPFRASQEMEKAKELIRKRDMLIDCGAFSS